MKLWSKLRGRFKSPEPQPQTESEESNGVKISRTVMDAAKAQEVQEHVPYEPPDGVIPAQDKARAMAMDGVDYSYLNAMANNGAGGFVGYYFPGFQELSSMAQLPEYRKMNEEPAREMVREWIKIHGTGDDDKSEKIGIIEAALKRHQLRDLFQQAAVNDSQFGRVQIYVEMKTNGGLASESPSELRTPLMIDSRKIPMGSLKGFRLIEPIWTYPSAYDADNPLSPDFYKPSRWYVMGKTVHDSRLLMFRSRPVPDLLKPAYNFSGVSMTQMARPYVEHWIRTRNSVSDLVHSFSTSGIKTNMSTVLQGGTDKGVIDRAQLYNSLRDNKGLLLLDKESEEFFQFNTPLGGLSDLQAQSQEHMAAVSNIPLVKLLGITPTGLNASSDGEIRSYYDYIHSMQEVLFRKPLEQVIRIIQLDQFGEIDPEIGFDFEPLYGMDEVQMSQVRLNNAQADAANVSVGSVSPDEVRQRLANDPDSGYEGLEVDNDMDERANLLTGPAREGGDPEDQGSDPAERTESLRTKARVNDG